MDWTETRAAVRRLKRAWLDLRLAFAESKAVKAEAAVLKLRLRLCKMDRDVIEKGPAPQKNETAG